MADDIYGVQSTGFVAPSLPDIRAQFRAAMQAQPPLGGTTLDLSSTGVLSQIIDVFANGLSDLWDASAGIYAGAYPSGATGVQVDHLLAIAGLARAQAKATVTNPTTSVDAGGNPLYGLVVYGTPGAVLPASARLSNGAAVPVQFATDAPIQIGAAANAKQAIQFSNSPTSGTYQLTLGSASGQSLTTPPIDALAPAAGSKLIFSALATGNDDDWTLTVSGKSVTLSFDANSASVQAAVRSISGYGSTVVLGSRSEGMTILWPTATPIVSVSGSTGPSRIAQSISDAVTGLQAPDQTHPLSDVQVEAYGQGFMVSFGAKTQLDGAQSNAATPVPLIQIASSSLFRNQTATSVTAMHSVFGHPAQGTGSATAVAAGSAQVLAGQLTTLLQPVSGISSVTNPLDCVTGKDVESDASAILRMQTSSSQSTATLSSIVTAVLGVSGVTQAIAFANSSNASEQAILFASTPTTGSFSLSVAGQTTASLPYSATAQDLQSALQSLPGLSDISVASAGQSSFLLRFGAQSGHTPHDLALVTSNSTGIDLKASFGCPAHAVEVVAQGGETLAVAQAILSTLPAGIATYGRQAASTTASISSGSNSAQLADATAVEIGQLVDAAHLPTGAQVESLTGTAAVLSQPASATNATESVTFGYGAVIDDGAGNSVILRFSRPKPVSIFANLTIVTDKSSSSEFMLTSVAGIQSKLIEIINAIPIGKPVIVSGTAGLANSFRDIPGILSVSLTIGRSLSVQSSDAMVLAPNETPIASAATVNIQVS